MKVYFVRHAESKLGAVGMHQVESTELSETGIKQAKILTKRFSRLPIDFILCSSHLRAKQTAAIINQSLKKPIEFTPLLGETRKPTEIQEKKADDLEVVEIKELIKKHYHERNWRYSDEETFDDLIERSEKAIDLILNLKKENILVVTHGMMMRIIVPMMILGGLTPDMFLRLNESVKISNTGITLCEFEGNKWILITWNDHTHLG